MNAMEICEQVQPPPLPSNQVVDSCMLTNLRFDQWTSLIAELENTTPVDIEKLSMVYDSFLLEFPLCYGYWRKYASHKARLCTVDKVVEVYDRAVCSATYSLHLWLDYCNFGILLFQDPVDIQRLFERGLSFVGKDYLCSLLWDKYIEYEYSRKNWNSLAHIYIRTLKYPTKKLHSYYDSFKKLASIWEEEIKCQSTDAAEVQSDATATSEITHVKKYVNEDISFVIKEILDPTVGLHKLDALQKYLSTGEKFYQKASELDVKMGFFESRIRRPYFHVQPLDVNQLKSWHQYLDFVEMHGDFDWTVKLYERCLIPCANYPEFWMRYIEFVDAKGGREIANSALDRATQNFLKRVPAIHLFSARFKEKIGDVVGSRDAFRQWDSGSDADVIENIKREANMEKRLGNPEAAFHLYEEALQMAIVKQKPDIICMLSFHLSRFKYMVTSNVGAARDVLIKGIQHLPHCKLLIQELLNFEMMHKGLKQMHVLDSIVTQAICAGPDVSQGLSNKDREDISSLYLEFLDHCGTIQDVMKAWSRHIELFPEAMRLTSFDDRAGRQDMVIGLPHQASGSKEPHVSVQPLQFNGKSSVPQNPDMEPDFAYTDSTKERPQPSASAGFVEQIGQDLNKQIMDDDNLVDEVGSQALVIEQEYPEVGKEQRKSNDDHNDDLRPLSLETLSLSTRNDETQNSNPTTSHDCETHRATPKSNGSRDHDGGYINEITSLSSLTNTVSGTKSSAQSDYDSQKVNDPGSLETRPHSQPLLPTSSTSNQTDYAGAAPGNASSGVHVSPEAPHPPQLQTYPQPQYQAPWMHPHTFRNQSLPSQLQTWQNPPVQPYNQAPNQHQGTASQVQPMSAYHWPAQNMQQQYFATAPQPHSQPQSISQHVAYPQEQAYQYPVQTNVQYGQMPGNQAFTPQMWHYYYQQQQQQHQHQPLQQFNTLQIQSWNSNYYQQLPVQHYGIDQCGQEYSQQPVQSQVQGSSQQNIEACGPSGSPYPQPNPPSNQLNSGVPAHDHDNQH